jgi:hypothetical protein
MSATQILLLGAAIGHGLLTILALNMSHGFGFNHKSLDRMVLSALAVVGCAAIATGWVVWGRPWEAWPLAIKLYSLACLGTLFLGLPGATLLRVLRRPPGGIDLLGEDVQDLSSDHGPDAFVGTSIRSLVLRLPGNDAFRLRRSEYATTLVGLPKSLDGLSILHLSDLHFSPAYSRLFFEEVVRSALAFGPEPDLVLITGDFLDDDAMTDWIVPILSPLRGRLGRFAVLGNHDYRHDFRGLRRALRLCGFTTLEGRWAVVDSGDDRIAIGGTSYPWGKDLFRRPAPISDLSLVLSHSPDEIYRAAGLGADAVFCGHNHGGQVRLPGIGPILTPSWYSRRFDRGFFRVGTTLMHVSQGVGAKDPLRVGCPPELTRIVLRCAEGAARADDREVDSVVSLAGS